MPFAQTAGSTGVSQLNTGAGLQGGPITSTGTISVSAPSCAGTDKLTWTGSAFQCAPDLFGGGGSGTVTQIDTGPGLSGGPITTSGAVSVNAPTCSSGETLTWNGVAFQCAALPPATDVQCTGCITSGDIQDGSITSADLQGGGIAGPDISVRVSRSSNFPAPTGPQCITFDNERWDTDSMFSLASDNELRVNTPGKYLVFAHVMFAGSTIGGTRQIDIMLQPSSVSIAQQRMVANGTSETSLSVATHYEFAAGDRLCLAVTQSSGSTLNVLSTPNASPEFGMVKIP